MVNVFPAIMVRSATLLPIAMVVINVILSPRNALMAIMGASVVIKMPIAIAASIVAYPLIPAIQVPVIPVTAMMNVTMAIIVKIIYVISPH